MEDGQHFIAKNLGMGISKGSLLVLNGGHAPVHSLGGVFTFGAPGTVATFSGLGGLAAMGVVGAISAAMAQMDYRYSVSKMKELYRNEVAAKLGKPPKSVSDDDLFAAANGDPERGIEGNKIIAEELDKKKKERTLGVLLSAGATMISFAVVHAAEAALLTAAGSIAGTVGLPVAAVAAVAMVLDVAVGVGIYNFVKQPLHYIGHKIFGLDKEGTHDKIESLHKELSQGKGVTQEQVLGVFVSANKQLQQFVENEFGKEYEKLTLPERQRVASEISKQVPLAEMTANINSGKYDIGELAFAVEGQASGYNPAAEQKPQGWLAGVTSKLRSMFKNTQTQTEPPQQAVAEQSPDAAYRQAAWHPANEQSGKASFTERYAGGRNKVALGHVERLEQSRNEPDPGSRQLV